MSVGRFLVWREDDGEDGASVVHAIDAQRAAEKWIDAYDADHPRLYKDKREFDICHVRNEAGVVTRWMVSAIVSKVYKYCAFLILEKEEDEA